MTTDLNYIADRLIDLAYDCAQRIATDGYADFILCENLYAKTLTPEDVALYWGDLVDAVRDLNRYLDGADYREHEHYELIEAREAALWSLIHGLPLEKRCERCVRGGRAVQHQGSVAVFNVCTSCADDGFTRLRQAIDAAVAR